LLRNVTATVTSSARASRVSVHISAMPRVLAEPVARFAHAVDRIMSKRDSATLAATVRDLVVVIAVRIIDEVLARASNPTLKIMTATNSSTMVNPRSALRIMDSSA